MKLLVFRRKPYRRLDFALIFLFLLISWTSGMSCNDPLLDLDDDTQLSSWIESIEFTQKSVVPGFGTDIRLTIDFELWNPGPFRIQFQSSTTALGIPYSIIQSNNLTCILSEYQIDANDAGGMMCASTNIKVGINHFQMTGWLAFNDSIPTSNPSLPDGNYHFILGNDLWINRYAYDVNVSDGILSHSSSDRPLQWDYSTVNLGNPYWYLIGIPFLLSLLLEWRTNVNEDIPNKKDDYE